MEGTIIPPLKMKFKMSASALLLYTIISSHSICTHKKQTHKMYIKLCTPKNILHIFLYKQVLNFHKCNLRPALL